MDRRHDGFPRVSSWMGLAVFVLSAQFVVAQDGPTPTSAKITSPERKWPRVARHILRSRGDDPRSLVFLIDPTKSVADSPFLGVMSAALLAGPEPCPPTAVMTVGQRGPLVFSEDPVEISTRLRSSVDVIDGSFHDLCTDIQRVAIDFANQPGDRDLIVVSLDNVDVEGELEETLAVLDQCEVRCSFVTRETALADSYWVWRRPHRQTPVPKDASLFASDAPFVDLPFSWLFQGSHPNERTASGYATYLCNRIATVSGGVVYMPRDETPVAHQCLLRGACRLCEGDHRPTGQGYLATRLRTLAPSAASRRDAGKEAAADPLFRAMVRAWEDAAKARIVKYGPPFEIRGEFVRPANPTVRAALPFQSARSFDTTKSQARRTRRSCERILETLTNAVERYAQSDCHPRYAAAADYTRFMLEVTRFNLRALEEWCDGVGAIQAGKLRHEFLPPEIPPFEEDQFFAGITWVELPLCHGVDAVRRVHLPGGEDLDKDLDRLAQVQREMRQKYAFSPFAALVDKAQATLFVSRMAGLAPPPRPRPTSAGGGATTRTAVPRPARGGSSARAGGASTGNR